MMVFARSATKQIPAQFAAICSLIIIVIFALPFAAAAQEASGASKNANNGYETAPVIVDGRRLFVVRGVSAFPAAKRAADVRDKVIAVARDDTVTANDVHIVETPDRSEIRAGTVTVTSVYDADAEVEGVSRQVLAQVYQKAIASMIDEYRKDRSAEVLWQNSWFALAATVLMALLVWGTLRLFRWLNDWAVRHVQHNLHSLAHKSHQLIHAGHLWTLVAGLLSTLRWLGLFVLTYSYLNTVLGLYPWTRPVARVLFNLIFDPLKNLWQSLLDAIPNLVFLFIIYLLVRYVLKVTRAFFQGVHNGVIKLKSFDADWALPTYKIVRVLICAFALVVAYPYIPGSDSLAFKGVSLFLGVIFSLGSSSFIANMLAGLAMTYRGAFKVGDVVKIGEVLGKVSEIKLMVTRITTPKNELVVIPNSNILNTNVLNYSTMARTTGLILHTTVSIGYDVPWRQVEAMLRIAAGRTQGLLKDPEPFVLQLGLGDFAVNYEINAFFKSDSGLLAVYSELHQHIQDVFNEHGVQIMSPAYESDPDSPKLVPPEKWYAEPAAKSRP